MLKGLQHISLVVKDLAKAKWFYGEYLGMDEKPRSRTFTFEGAWFHVNGTEVHMIMEHDTTAPAGFAAPAGVGEQTGLATHFAFEVFDVHALKQRAIDMNIEVVGGVMGRGDGVHQLYVRDPDGYLIELFQWVDAGETATERAPVKE